MAVKTTKIQCNQDVDVRGKVDIEGKVTCGGDAEVDGGIYAHGKDITIGVSSKKSPILNGLFLLTNGCICFGYYDVANNKYAYLRVGDHKDDIECKINAQYISNFSLSLTTLSNRMKEVRAYRHSLTLTCGTTATYYIDLYSPEALLIDSIQDLTTVTHQKPFGCGTAQATYANGIWTIGGATLTAVSDILSSQ